jgi:Ras-related protein Rab-28
MAATQAVKLILVGNGSAGKTSICTRFREDGFQRVYRQTVGIDFLEKTLKVRDKLVALQVWDIGGQSIGSKMLPQYVWGADLVFLCYDVTDMQSFADAEDWLRLVRRRAPEARRLGGVVLREPEGAEDASVGVGAPVYLLGNKVDLGTAYRRVTETMHQAFIESNGLQGGFLVSARSGEGVLTAFYSAAAAFLGVSLTALELELTEKVLAVTVAAPGGSDDARLPGADKIEAEDRAAAERAAKGDCCSIA